MKSKLSRPRCLALGAGMILTSAFGQAPASGDADSLASRVRNGHSAMGDAFDSGPRQKPWVMSGIGVAHFPITTNIPELQ